MMFFLEQPKQTKTPRVTVRCPCPAPYPTIHGKVQGFLWTLFHFKFKEMAMNSPSFPRG